MFNCNKRPYITGSEKRQLDNRKHTSNILISNVIFHLKVNKGKARYCQNLHVLMRT